MKRILYIIAVTLFFIDLMLTSIMWLSFRDGYYNKMYTKLEVAETIGITSEDLHQATDVLQDYIRGLRPSLDMKVTINNEKVEMFNQREKDHMVDVRNLYGSVRLFRNLSVIFVAGMLMLSLGSGDYLDFELNRDVLGRSLFLLTFFFVSLGLYAFIDFDSFWRTFHQLVFSNDLWLLNPATDRLIMMVPLQFFMGLVYRILISFSLIIGVGILVYFFFDWRVKRDTRRLV